MGDLVQRLNRAIPTATIEFTPTAGSFVVVDALQRGDGEFGFAQADVVYQAYRHGTEADPQPHQNLRGIAVLWTNQVFLITAKDSPVNTVSELRGRRIAVGPRGSSAEFLARIVLGMYGLDYEDVDVTNESNEDIVRDARSRHVDVGIVVAIQFPAAALDATHPIRLIPLDRSAINRIRSRYPFIAPIVSPAGLVAEGIAPIDTIGVDGLLVCRRDLSDDLVYEVTKQFLALFPTAFSIDGHSRIVDLSAAPATPIPLHSGAARFYREQQVLDGT
jgi:TRAP transporter TAXI family solute receptor